MIFSSAISLGAMLTMTKTFNYDYRYVSVSNKLTHHYSKVREFKHYFPQSFLKLVGNAVR